ncbi:MAG: response regulator [Gammaproteobacteria bacterium]|nr:response regulator [Gammaproteobacteria bacterium]
MSEKIKVLIVDDASFMVKAVRDILESDPDIEVIGTAKNGKDALEKIKQLKPDVITLDVDMPIMDGISAVRHIMIHEPVPIVMLSSLFEHGDITFEALRLGVVDFLPKLSGAISRDIHDQGHQIVERVKIAAAENINNVHRVKLSKIDVREQLSERYGFNDMESIITMGTTLGGPNTIIRIMSKLSPDLPAAVIVIQEIGVNILPAFVEEFNKYTPWKVEVGSEGQVLEAGSCYICSYNEPMSVHLNDSNEVVLKHITENRKPLDTLFSTAAEIFEQNTVGVLLTGVGADGEQGFEEIKEHSGVTIAQNTATCVYPNLTQCAIEHGVVDYIEDADQLSEQIEKAVRSKTQDNYVVTS